LTGSERVGSCF